MRKTVWIPALVALIVSLCTIGLYQYFFAKEGKTLKIEHIDSTPAKSAVYTLNDEGEVIPLDFTKIAEQVMDVVVHIQSTQTLESSNRQYENQDIPDPFRDSLISFLAPITDSNLICPSHAWAPIPG